MRQHSHEIGFYGSSPHTWLSVEKARQFFLNSLSQRFDVHHLDLDHSLEDCDRNKPKVIVNFASQNGWKLAGRPASSLMFAMLGGSVVNRDFLSKELNKIRPSDYLIVHCNSDVSIIREMCEHSTPKLPVLPLPIDLKTFTPHSKGVSRDFALCEEFDFVIGFVARLLPQKNLHLFLYELSALRKALAPATVGGIIVGNYWVDYPCLPYETAIYPDRIRDIIDELDLSSSLRYFPASLTEEELACCYSAMDVLYHPTASIDENFGYVPLEAMACGVPVVGSAYGGLKDSIIDGQTGILMPTWITSSGIRIDLLRGHVGIMSILESTKNRERMSRMAIEHVTRNYSFDHCSTLLCAIVEQAIEAPIERAFVLSKQPQSHGSNISTLLPHVEPPWESFVPSVRHYVSRLCPSVSDCQQIRCASPLKSAEPGHYRLVDPAWPAQFDLTNDEVLILQYLNDWRKPDTVLREFKCDRERLDFWLASGLLIGSDCMRDDQ